MHTETFERSLWSVVTPAAAPTEPLEGDVTADVAIVGAGFLGLSTALHLAEAGVQAVVLEAEAPGYGASGRNTGFVVPSFKTALGPAEVEAALGRERGERLTDLVHGSGDYLFGLVERHGIACDAERVGWMQPAHTEACLHRLAVRVRQMAERGRPVSLLSATETEQRTGIKGYFGALLDASGGQLNPLAYARGLARSAGSAGATIHGKSRVRGIASASGAWQLTTDRGGLTAKRVLLATNALVGSLVKGYGNGFVPVRIHQIATRQLDAVARARILVGRSPLSDTRRHTFAVRLSPDGRLVTGGLVVAGPNRLARATRAFTARLGRFFPDAAPFQAKYVWDGIIASTPSGLPFVTTIAPGLDAAIGCNGRGVALTTILGRELAGWLAGRIADCNFVLPVAPVPNIPFRRLVALGPSLWLPWSEFRDWTETRHRRG